jgi:hypothetical protein
MKVYFSNTVKTKGKKYIRLFIFFIFEVVID